MMGTKVRSLTPVRSPSLSRLMILANSTFPLIKVLAMAPQTTALGVIGAKNFIGGHIGQVGQVHDVTPPYTALDAPGQGYFVAVPW